ncbi:uncharacterized protein LOC127255765 [Andrographis paniculata]|uniref:uncharacterized protein LOC127255765 n=1 Tax=Andrographis paniculata TaxID=175694 RepID=UPI0021E7C840|nr:uncharacterized protein LOC127255765 [Andrographis paniculata]XP_051137442.1 uncharacterized protein LOC127255765 [Andrographis paniculata]
MTGFVQIQPFLKNPSLMSCSILCRDDCLMKRPWSNSRETLLTPKKRIKFRHSAPTENGRRMTYRKGNGIVCNGSLFPVDPWAPTVDSESIASQLFAFSLFPYLGFLYFITKSKSAPKLTLFGFYFLLAFVGATIPAGIYAKVHYGTSLSNVDWLHGGAESMLTLTNIFIVLGLREALRKGEDRDESTSDSTPGVEDKEKSSV